MSLRETVKGLGQNTSRAVLDVLGQHRAGDIDLATARDLIAVILETAGAQAESVGVLGFMAQSLQQTGEVREPGADILSEDRAAARRETIDKSLTTITDGPDDELEMRLERLGRVSPIDTAAKAFGAVMAADVLVEGWTRGLGSKPCDLCTYWADGAFHETDHTMPRHPGCSCSQVPAFKTVKKRSTDYGETAGAAAGPAAGPAAGARSDRGGGIKPKPRQRRRR